MCSVLCWQGAPKTFTATLSCQTESKADEAVMVQAHIYSDVRHMGCSEIS